MKRTLLIGGLILFLMTPTLATAALLDYSFTNIYDGVDRIELSVTQNYWLSNNTIESALFGGSASPGWTIDSGAQTESVVLLGPAIADSSGVFDLSFNDNASPFWSSFGGPNWLFDFTLQWTEFSGGTSLGQVNYTFEDGVIATPLPASAWMLLSGLAMFIGIRRQKAQ